MDNSFAQHRRDALAALIGEPLPRPHVAVPPLHLGGGVDVLSFNAREGGVTYVTAGLTNPTFPQRYGAARFELSLHTREPNEWAARLLSRVGPHSAGLRFPLYGALPIHEGALRLGGLVFAPHEPRSYFDVDKERYLLLRCVGVSPDELAACHTAGVPSVLAALERAGAYPFTDANRGTVPHIDTLLRTPPGSALLGHLSPGGRRGFLAVLHGISEDVEHARENLTPADVPVLAVIYLQLPSWPQRALLVHLTQDHHHPSLHHVWRHVLGHPDPEDRSEGHATLAIALAGLEQNFDAFGVYWNDLPGTLARAREHRAKPAV
ncbi:MAG: suppressor of fused domain protein [Pseudomonadota bacterium]|nr:suppressor of fused domain protein [Pseudomonadota bacterium]